MQISEAGLGVLARMEAECGRASPKFVPSQYFPRSLTHWLEQVASNSRSSSRHRPRPPQLADEPSPSSSTYRIATLDRCDRRYVAPHRQGVYTAVIRAMGQVHLRMGRRPRFQRSGRESPIGGARRARVVSVRSWILRYRSGRSQHRRRSIRGAQGRSRRGDASEAEDSIESWY